MKLLEPIDFVGGFYPERFTNEIISKFLMKLVRLNKVNKIYEKNIDKQGLEFINSVIENLQIHYTLNETELARIPETGPFVTVSNYPLGGLESLILLKIILEKRPDFKILANNLLSKIEPLKDFAIASISGIKKALQSLEAGNALGIFPAINASIMNKSLSYVSDKKWSNTILKFIKNTEVPVIPIHFQGSNTALYHILGNIHPLIQSARLPKEIVSIKNKDIKVRIGMPVTVKEQQSFQDISKFGRFLRAKTYALHTHIEVKKFFKPRTLQTSAQIEPVIDAIDPLQLKAQIEHVKKDYLLFESSNFSVVCAPASEMPDVLTELGRLREITFRAVGEGTNRGLDVDEFDLYFYHLVIWDNDENKIAGAYRVGKGKEIMQRYGVKGFYIQTLFKIGLPMFPVLRESLELGRSFIIQEYQRKPLSLFLLWKGILYFLLKNPEYRYMIGPASISNDFSKFSKGLIVEFFEHNYFDNEIAQHITPRKRFKITRRIDTDVKVFLENTGNDLAKLDKYVQEIDPGFRIPVLLKKYISLNAKVIGFNIDPLFNDCLDGLILLDILDVPMHTIKALSKEINDESILKRFNVNE